MSIQKKSLISTLKTAKKANVASAHENEVKGEKVASLRHSNLKHSSISARSVSNNKVLSGKTTISAKNLRNLKSTSTKKLR